MNEAEGHVHREDRKNSVGRLIFVGISVLLQLAWFSIIVLRLSENYLWISLSLHLIAAASALGIFGKHTNPTIKMSWIFFIMAVPILGWGLYFMSYRSNFVKTMDRRFQTVDRAVLSALPDNEEILSPLLKENPGVGNQLYFLKHSCGFPPYRDTEVDFYGDTREALEAQKLALRNAEHFIFMEYHAIENRIAFGELKEILIEKAAGGVEVRVFYDDIGSIGFIDPQFIREMSSYGISCRVFNPIVPIVNLFMNNRDHRKITVVDGRIGFTGGYNLADKYFNLTHPYGLWKDSGIRLEGPAVRTLTLLFLEMWNAMDEKPVESVNPYLLDFPRSVGRKSEGIVVPYADDPVDSLCTGEDVYLNILKNAKHYVFIATPYLIITDDMSRELTLAARRGVDVRIVTPGIPDKKLIYQVTRSYYNQLARDGVRIYEFTPGFLHEKQILSDDECAVVGTINFDYRSLYHHFEDAVYLYRSRCLPKIREDFSELFRLSLEVTKRYGDRSMALRLGQGVLRLFAPLM